VQERLTKQVADYLHLHLCPRGVGVVIEAEHMCMTLRGVQAVGSRTVTSTLLGALREDARSRAEFLAAAAVGQH
jgi:GTP cyclohydrolase I